MRFAAATGALGKPRAGALGLIRESMPGLFYQRARGSHFDGKAVKKLSFRRKCWLERRRLRIACRRKQRSAGEAEIIRTTELSRPVSGEYVRVRWQAGKKNGWILAKERLPMPTRLDLEKNYEATAVVLAGVRNRLLTALDVAKKTGQVPKRFPSGILPSFYDFTTIESCSPAAALVIAAEYDRVRRFYRWAIPVINLDQWNPGLLAMLDGVGFFKLLGIERPQYHSPNPNLRVLPFRTGSTVGQTEASELIWRLESPIGEPQVIDEPTLRFGALVEATENTCHHAYTEEPEPFAVKQWWMTGAIDKSQNRLNLIVFDQGLTIPATLSSWARYPWVAKGLRRLRRFWPARLDQDWDADRLRLAMDAPRSSTGEMHRGKGFPAFRDVLEESREGSSLRIISRRGELFQEKGKKAQGRVLNTPLRGTLIEWNLRL